MVSRTDTTGTDEPKAPLSGYVRAFLAREGLSARQFALRGVDPEGDGNRLLVQWVIHLLDDQLSRKAPELWRLRALAAAMAFRPDTGMDRGRYNQELNVIKKLTAAQWLEMTVLEVETIDGSIVTISVPPDLSDEKRQQIREFAEQMVRMLSAEN